MGEDVLMGLTGESCGSRPELPNSRSRRKMRELRSGYIALAISGLVGGLIRFLGSPSLSAPLPSAV